MSDPFIGEIKIVGFTYAPRGWAFCNGQLLAISTNQVLFALLGTTYGGDGRTTFALPDLRGRFPIHPGTGSGLTSRRLGEQGGTESHTLTLNQMPAHNHSMNLASGNEGEATSPAGNILAVSDDRNYVSGTGTAMGPTGNSGSSQPVNHMPPYGAVNFIIALQGLFPPRN
ncbi:MAG: tail fiber protein [Gammaproteobacteria bacterium]|nr:tail fiber protein [Gammaproteobacteria bacterium]